MTECAQPDPHRIAADVSRSCGQLGGELTIRTLRTEWNGCATKDADI
jgi:hypothetical protein